MLVMSEDDPLKVHSMHHKTHLVHHQDLIVAVKEAIKPGACQAMCQPFTKNMINRYFLELTNRKI